ncbi:AraC-like DNA-binding protein [Pseudomonas sp. 3296]|jgi:AraC-like DNA-binding protein|uniref:AraC family transcriptional regulator n=1 Tax=Pseudomonas sp. 3296 TaxID=2817753 RepID=UPI00285838BB|nr:AraC family transcriptional regulator ligand-binding domain-containing protein [Pseudomonas sp. 3296]MDR6918891.1 AraC-like DNA-binding protein [Pseudomonas sp. 3296]
MATNTFLVSFGMIGLRIIETYGLNTRSFTLRLDVPTSTVQNNRARLSADFADAGFMSAMTLISDPAFALRAAECWHPSDLQALGYAWLSSGSLHTALRRLERYICILAGRAALSCTDKEAGICLIYDTGRGNTPLGHTMADFGLSLIIAMCRTNLRGPLRLHSVHLKRPRPVDPAPYERFFASEVTFGADHDSFVLPWSVVNRPLPTGNAEMAQVCDDILVGELAKISGSDLVHRCRRFLIENVASGEPSEERLAEAMAMSRRSLQRKLAERGQSYRSILDRIRHDLARKYLAIPDKSLTEIAFLLGFSEQTSFARAFKRWQGLAPSDYRNLPHGQLDQEC